MINNLLKTPEQRFKAAVAIGLIFFIFLISIKGSSGIAYKFFPSLLKTNLSDDQIESSLKSKRNIVWYETELKVVFKDSTSNVFKIDVYETLDDISVIDGNLSYWKYNEDRPHRKIDLASYVNYYTVLSSTRKTE